MRGFFYKFLKNLFACFHGYYLLWQIFAVALTYLAVTFGFDWFYFQYTRSILLRSILFPAVIAGALLPILVPFVLLAVGKIKKNPRTVNTAYVLGQAVLMGWMIPAFYKALTGRVPPPEVFGHGAFVDVSREFQFGLLRGGIFWGWPSSHATVAFALAAALIILYPKNKVMKYGAIAYAIYVGVAVSMTIHWFSEFAAGAIIGTVIGTVVGKSYREKYFALEEN